MPVGVCWILIMLCLVALLACMTAAGNDCDATAWTYGAPLELPPGLKDTHTWKPQQRLSVDELSVELPLPPAHPTANKPDDFVQETFARNIKEGEVFQQEIVPPPPAVTTGPLQQAAQQVESHAVVAASPKPPRFEPLSLDVLPQKYWQPVFSGCQSTFTDKQCDFSYPTPRLWVPTLNELQYARSLDQGQVNLIEPMQARQALAQLLTIGVRTRKDVYTQASPANDIASQSPCAQLKKQSPAYVWR